MAEYFMGSELTQQEWPPNARRPRETPPEGIILTETNDGWTRRILYKSMGGHAEEILISQTPPKVSKVSLGMENSLTPIELPVTLVQESVPGEVLAPTPRPFEHPPVPVNVPLMGSTSLGQELPPPACPEGPIEMPDGRVLEPDDSLSVKDVCAIFGQLFEAYTQAPPAEPGAPVPVVGGVARPGVQPGAAAGGVGAFLSGGGGPGATGPQGPAGPTGPTGATGVGSADFIVKTDGDFTAGPGAFVPVPGTLVSFTQSEAGPVLLFLQAVFGCSPGAQNAQIGIRLDGTTVFPLAANLVHTFAGGVNEFLVPASSFFPLTVAAGAHTVEVVLRGIAAGEFCAGSGLGLVATVQANASVPLALAALHR